MTICRDLFGELSDRANGPRNDGRISWLIGGQGDDAGPGCELSEDGRFVRAERTTAKVSHQPFCNDHLKDAVSKITEMAKKIPMSPHSAHKFLPQPHL